MGQVNLKADLAIVGVVKANLADLAVHPHGPLGEPAGEVDDGDDEGVGGMEGEVEVEGEVDEGLEDGKEGHEKGIDNDFAWSTELARGRRWRRGDGVPI